jgi:hypothetical protein
MDPNATYENMIANARHILHLAQRDKEGLDGLSRREKEALLETIAEIAGDILNLDTWLRSKGFLPKAWQR